MNRKLQNRANFISGLNVYCGPLLKYPPFSSHLTGREIVWNKGTVNEYETQSSIISIVGIIMRKV
jgi:hypothetical protein